MPKSKNKNKRKNNKKKAEADEKTRKSASQVPAQDLELSVQHTGLTSSAYQRGCFSLNLQGLMPYGTRARG